MNKTFIYIFINITLFILFSCEKDSSSVDKKLDGQKQDSLNIFTNASSVALFEEDSIWDYQILLDKSTKSIKIPKDKLPLKNMAILSASSVGYLEALNDLDAIKGVFDAQWIYSPALHQRIKDNPNLDKGNLSAINLEKIIALAPDVVIGFSDPNMYKTYQRLEEAGVLMIYVDEYNEKTPLGKAEFIKLYGVLTGKLKEAKELYQEIETNYLSYRELALKQEKRPTAFAEIMRGDIWYMPGGESFAAQYFKDAGANYLWSNDTSQGSVKLNFEQVYEKAADADFWMNASDLTSLNEVQSSYINHDWFKAYKNENVYSLSKRMNKAGANDYFETGSVRADWVLKDLIHIFHPEVFPKHELFFYHKLAK